MEGAIWGHRNQRSWFLGGCSRALRYPVVVHRFSRLAIDFMAAIGFVS
jgi:hypothetical protein